MDDSNSGLVADAPKKGSELSYAGFHKTSIAWPVHQGTPSLDDVSSAARSSFDLWRTPGGLAGAKSGPTPSSPSPNPTCRTSPAVLDPATNNDRTPPSPPNTSSHPSRPAQRPSTTVGVDGTRGDQAVAPSTCVGMEKMEGLKKSVAELGVFSTTTAQRLENTYYSVLARLSMLQSTIQGIKELATMSKQMDHDFILESNEVVGDIQEHLESFGNFERHQDRIAGLQMRILRGQQRIRALSQRLDVVGDRIDGWEKADKEWQERTRKRLKLLWFLVIPLVAAVCLVFIFFIPGDDAGDNAGGEASGLGLPDIDMREAEPSNHTGMKFKHSCTSSDDRLRIFDEL